MQRKPPHPSSDSRLPAHDSSERSRSPGNAADFGGIQAVASAVADGNLHTWLTPVAVGRCEVGRWTCWVHVETVGILRSDSAFCFLFYLVYVFLYNVYCLVCYWNTLLFLFFVVRHIFYLFLFLFISLIISTLLLINIHMSRDHCWITYLLFFPFLSFSFTSSSLSLPFTLFNLIFIKTH